MGAFVSSLCGTTANVSDPNPRALFFGPSDGGASTLLNMLIHGYLPMPAFPTIGFNIVTVPLSRGKQVDCWDVGGNCDTAARVLWRHYAFGASAIVFCVDGANPNDFKGASKMLFTSIVGVDAFADMPLLVVVTKQDLVFKYIGAEEVSVALGLGAIEDREVAVLECSSASGQGTEGVREYLSKLEYNGNNAN
jgi:small GTP-binding protein